MDTYHWYGFGRAEDGRNIQQKGCSYTGEYIVPQAWIDSRDRQDKRRHPGSPLAALSIDFRPNASLLGCLGYGTVSSYAICLVARHCVNGSAMVVVIIA